MIPEQVIINADDLGISEHVNEAIFDLMAEKRISSATVMANGPALHHAASKLKHFPRCSFGAHLNLTEFQPVSAGRGAALLTDADGIMSRSILKKSFSLNLLSAMYEELCSQVNRLKSAGVGVSHFDSHHHVHTNPRVLPILKALQRRFGVHKVRITKNIYTCEVPVSSLLARQKLVYNWTLRKFYSTRTTEGFT